MLTRTLSQMWKRLYLPVFLFRMGLLTLIYMDFLIVLTMLCSSLSTMLKLALVVWCLLVVWWPFIGEGTFKCSLYLSLPKYSNRFSNIFLVTFNPVISIPVYNTNGALYGIYIFLVIPDVLDSSVASEV